MKERYLETGKIVNTHGIAGEVKILPWADAPDFLLDFDTLLAAAAGCDAIINCAGTTDMRLPRTEDFLPVNRDLPALLCRVLDATGIRTLDLPSSLTVFDHGRLPFLMRRGTADVSLAVSRGAWKVYALSPGGRRRREVPYRFDDLGRMHLLCDTAAEPSSATFAYELVR